MNDQTKRRVCLGIALLGMAILLAYELLGLEGKLFWRFDASLRYLLSMTLTRLIAGGIFTAMLINLGYRILSPVNKGFWRSLPVLLPAFLVAVNNFPFSCVIRGEAVITSPWWVIALVFFECLCVAFFEETAFRGVVFLGLAARKPRDRRWVFWSVVLSGVIFGLIHIVNLYQSSPLAVLMQIGYSALVGAMCSVVLIKTANLWLCIFLHALFNFGGAVVQYCGSGIIWDTFTIVLTAIIAVLTTVHLIFVFLRADLDVLDGIFRRE